MRGWAAAAIALAVGCAEPEPPPPEPRLLPAVWSFSDFRVLDPGDEVPVEYGAAGGIFLPLGAQVERLATAIELTFELYLDGQAESDWRSSRRIATLSCAELPDGSFDDCEAESAVRYWWGANVPVPCHHQPLGGFGRTGPCIDPPTWPVDEAEVVLRVHAVELETEEVREPQEVVAEVAVDVVCCVGL